MKLLGGGKVVLRHGPLQRVTLIRGSLGRSSVWVDPGTRIPSEDHVITMNADQLVIDTCTKPCEGYELLVEVITPSIKAVAVHGPGTLETRGSFPRQSNVAADVESRGEIDLRSMPVSNLRATAKRGGRMLVRVERYLAFQLNGGGEIRYWGDPAVGGSTEGGGLIGRGQ